MSSGDVGATWALIAAAGSGGRLGIDRPKAFAGLGGRPLLAESLDRLDRCELVDAIVVAAPAGWGKTTVLVDWLNHGEQQPSGRKVDVA